MPIAPIIEDTTEPGPRGNYRKTAATRARILDAALDVFGEAGFDKGSLREVAEKAGISQAGLLHHYPNKVALLSAVLERRDERALSGLSSRPNGVEHLAYLVAYARESSLRPGEIDLFAVLSAEATRPDHPANDYMRRRYHWVSGIMRTSFEEAARAGLLREGIDPGEAASQLIALWDGLQIQWLLRVNDVVVADRLEQFIDLQLVRPLREIVQTEPA